MYSLGKLDIQTKVLQTHSIDLLWKNVIFSINLTHNSQQQLI